MPHRDTHLADRARLALGVVRLVNGALGIVAPGVLIHRLGGDPAANPAARYAFRLFGVRTVLLAAELLLATGPVRERARRIAVIVHASDTAIAVWGLWRRELPPRVALVTVAISAGNAVLAVLSRPRRVPRNQRAEPITHERRQQGPGSGRPYVARPAPPPSPWRVLR